MATQPSEMQGNSNQAEPPADVYVSVGTAPSPSRGAPGVSEEVVDGHYYRPLLRAAFGGDWKFAKRFFEQDSASKTAEITSRSETVLHIAALSAQDQFVENLVKLLSPEALEKADCDGRTALHNATMCGRIRMVKALVRSKPTLTQLKDNEGRTPLLISAQEASTMQKEISWLLAKKLTDDGFFPLEELCIAGHQDITLYLVAQFPHLIEKKSEDIKILSVLAKKELHFLSGTKLSFLESLIYKCIPVDLNYKPTDEDSSNMQTSTDPAFQCLTRSLWNVTKIIVPTIKRIHEVKLKHTAAVELAKKVCIAISYMKTTEITQFFEETGVLGQATIKGISELVKLFIQFYPEIIWMSPYGKSLMTLAVEFRQERILRLFLKESSNKELSLVPALGRHERRWLMFAAGRYNSEFDAVNVSGAAFQMQRELQWFGVVEKLATKYVEQLSPKTIQYRQRNAQKSGITPEVVPQEYIHKKYWKIFVEEHKELRENGEKWMKDTANSCMLVSTLIATVLFAGAFTVPGGNDGNTGIPLLLGQDSLLVFAISDALGLFSSVTAILLFLAILTSRFEPLDFLESLPKKITLGLSFLFLSLAFMLVAFAAALTIMLDKRLEWVLFPITLLTSIPVALFLVLQLPLLYQMVRSTYGPSIFRPESIWE